MATQQQRKKNNHFPDWLFYFLSALSLISLSLFVKFYETSSSLVKELEMKTDSLIVERELSSMFDTQREVIIENSGTTGFIVARLFVFYFDKKENKFKSYIGHVAGEIKPNGTCRPWATGGDKTIWDGNALSYYIEVVSVGNYYKEGIRFCKSGTFDEDKKIVINADSRSQIIDIEATCRSSSSAQ